MLRCMKISPGPASKIEATWTRLSQHEITIADGFWPLSARCSYRARFAANLDDFQPLYRSTKKLGRARACSIWFLPDSRSGMPGSCLAARSQSSSNTDGGSRKRASARSRDATRIGRPPSWTHCAPAAGQGNRARGTLPGFGMTASRPFEEQWPEPATRQGNAGHRATLRRGGGQAIGSRQESAPGSSTSLDHSWFSGHTWAPAGRRWPRGRTIQAHVPPSFRLRDTGDPGLGVPPKKCQLHWPALAPNLIAWGQLPRRDQVWPTAGV